MSKSEISVGKSEIMVGSQIIGLPLQHKNH